MQLTSKTLTKQLQHVQDLEKNLTYKFSRIAKLLEGQTISLLGKTDLNLTSYRIIRIVGIFEAITISDLARLMVIDRAQISRASTELEKQGYVEGRADPTSKRKKLLVLTPKARKTLEELAPAFEERRNKLDTAIGDDKLKELHEAMNKISDFLYDEQES